MSSRPAWSTELVPGQVPKQYRESLSGKTLLMYDSCNISIIPFQSFFLKLTLAGFPFLSFVFERFNFQHH